MSRKGKGKGRRGGYSWKDLLRGRAMRDEAIERVLKNAQEWTPMAQNVVLHLCELRAGERMTGEQISAAILEAIGKPHHHNALGGVGNWYVTFGLVIRVGWVPMRKPRSHARLTPLYQLGHPRDAVPPDERMAAE